MLHKKYKLPIKLIRDLKRIAKQYGTKIVFRAKLAGGGLYDSVKRTIFINYECIKNRRDLINAFFHELGHHYCVINNIWKTYHFSGVITQSYIYTALKAERWIDNWAAKQIKVRYPKIKYDFPYSDEENVEWFWDYIKTTTTTDANLIE